MEDNGIPDVDALLLLPEILEGLEKLDQERKYIGRQARFIAKLLEDSETESIQNDRVGTGFAIGGSIVTATAVALAPWTGGISLVVANTGLIGAVAGTTKSAAANRSARVLERNMVKNLDQIWQKHVEQIEKFNSSYPPNLIRASKMQSTLDALVRLSSGNGMQLITALLTSTMGEGDGENIDETLNNIDPTIKEWIGTLFSFTSPEFRQKAAAFLTLLFGKFRSMTETTRDFVTYVARNGLSRITECMTSDWRCTGSILGSVGTIRMQGMPSAKAAYGVAAAAIFAFKACHMYSIWNASGETKIVQALRKMADDLEIRDQPV